MRHSRFDIVIAAHACLPQRKTCPRTCPLLQEEHCQRFICRELIRLYEETKGQIFDGEDESLYPEEETQEEA